MTNPLLRAFLFLVLTAPIYLFPGLLSVDHPLLLLVLLIALTWVFLKWENRKLSVLGLDPTWPRAIQLLAGLGFGMLLIASIAICIRLLLPFKWALNPNFKWDAALLSLLYYLIGNAVEELIFRGYSFERLITGGPAVAEVTKRTASPMLVRNR